MIDGASLGSILSVWLTICGCGLLAWPLVALLFPTDPDRGYLAAKPLAWVAGSYTAWLGAVGGLPFAHWGWGIGLTALALGFLVALPAARRLRFPGWRRIAVLEAGFVVLLLVGALIKARVPDIHGLEKYMDFAFVNAALRAQSMPPADPWWGGEPINYYYFGHVAAAWLIQLSRVPADHGFNLMIGVIFAFAGSLSFRLVSGVLAAGGGRRVATVSGTLAAVLVTLGGNFHSVLYGPFRAFSPTTYERGFYYPDSTRFVGFDPPTQDHGFTEMPAYGFAVGDLHAHVLNLPVALLIALLLVRILQREWTPPLASGGVRLGEVAALGLLFGVTAMCNSWDAISYGVLMVLVGLLLLVRWGFRQPWQSLRLMGAALLVLILSGAVASPFLLGFVPIASSLMWTDTRTPLWQLAVLYAHVVGPFVVLIGGALLWRRHDGRWIVGATLAALTVILIALPEIAYVKDIYGFDHRRANTMFKFHFEAQPMAFLASAVLLGLLLQARRWWGALSAAVLAVPLLATLSYAGEIYGDVLRKADRLNFTLHGLGFVDRDHAADRPLIDWLRAQPADSRLLLVEAAGNSYSEAGRLSALTGVPALLGWSGHEWLWRGDNTTPFKRHDEIAAFYQEADFGRACQFVHSRGVTHVAIGTIERATFPALALATLERLGQRVAGSGDTALIAVVPSYCDNSGAS